MNSSPKTWLEAAAYDPSYRRADTGSYWQWSNVPVGAHWNQGAKYVNQGWPSVCRFSNFGSRWYGVLPAGGGKFWIYRIYAAGRDRFGREGRYFFILVLLQSEKDLLNPKVAGLFSYFDTERGLPLNTIPLDEGWVDAEPDEILRIISKKLNDERSLSHWGITDGGHITVFSKLSPLLQVSSALKPEYSENGVIIQTTDARPVPRLLPYLSAFLRRRRGRPGRTMKFIKICTGVAFICLVALLGVEQWRKAHMPEGGETTSKGTAKPKRETQKPSKETPPIPEPSSDGEDVTPPPPKTQSTQSQDRSTPVETTETEPES